MILTLLLVDLTVSDGGLLESGQTRQWEWGAPTSGPVGLGSAWGTNLSAPYLHDTVDTLEVALPDLSQAARPMLRVRHWYDIAPGDVAIVEIHDGTGWVELEPVFGYPDPAGFVGTSAGYVEHAWSLSGHETATQLRFRLQADLAVALDGWFIQTVEVIDGDVVPPLISPVAQPVDTQDLSGPYDVVVNVLDDVGVTDVLLHWEAAGIAQSVPMQPVKDGAWRGQIPGQAPDTLVTWSVSADDGTQVTWYPDAIDAAFRVFLAAPRDLRVEPVGLRPVAQSIQLAWDPPDSPHPVTGYRVFDEARLEVLAANQSPAVITLIPQEPQVFSVQAEYDAGAGDVSEPMELDFDVPQLVSVDPPGAHAGDTVHVTLVGDSLYLDETSTLNLGPGIEVLSLDVEDAHTADATVADQGRCGGRGGPRRGVERRARYLDVCAAVSDSGCGGPPRHRQRASWQARAGRPGQHGRPAPLCRSSGRR